MTQYRVIRKAETGEIVLARARVADNFWSHFRGLMLVSDLPDDEGLLFVYNFESRANTAIHMLFMLFDIAVVWMDKHGKVVDKRLAKVWRPAYTPSAPAQYFIEANPVLLDRVQVGDVLRFDETASP